MTDLESLQDELVRREALPACWSGAARTVVAIGFGKDVRPWNWLELDEHEAEKLWAHLDSFVSFFNARYGERSANRIPPCWAEHGPVAEEVTTLAFTRWQAFSSSHASIGGAQHFHGYVLPSFYDRLRFWLGNDLLACQQGRHHAREHHGPDDGELEAWRSRTETIRDEDLWLRLEADEAVRVAAPSLVPFVDRQPQ